MDAGIFVPTRALLSADAVAILADPALPDPIRLCLERFFRWGAAPTVDAYCDLFAPEGTLLDADMDRPIRGDAIGESMTRVLQLLPDFRFRPLRLLHEEPHVFVLAANRASLADRALVWHAIYALTLTGDRIGAGRRYYDQAALATGAETFAIATPADAEAPLVPRPAAVIDVAARIDAWTRRDVAALRAPLGAVRLHMAGVARPLVAEAAITEALQAFAARSDGLRLAPGAVVRSPAGTAIEWVGTVGAGGAARRFALVELCASLPEPREWHLLFNTLGF